MKESKVLKKINNCVIWMDRVPFWWLVLILGAVTFAPYFVLKEGSVFPVHDQLDETILTYVLNAGHMGSGADVFPELLGGINASGMQPAAILFVPLYRLFPTFVAFLIQYAVVFAAGFLGMYFCVKELTSSSVIAVAMAGCFSLLPVQPIYGLSVVGVPLLFYACQCLYRNKHRGLSFFLIIFFGLTTHLVLSGYVVLGIWAVALFVLLLQRKRPTWLTQGFALLLGTYVVVNRNLIKELLFGQGDYVSHREELVNIGTPFWNSVCDLFVDSAQHAPSLHKYLIIPIILMILIVAVKYNRIEREERRVFWTVVSGFFGLVEIALLYGFLRTDFVQQWKNSVGGILHYFQMERFYWLYPAGWYLEFALAFSLWWKEKGSERNILQMPVVKVFVLLIVLFPTMNLIKESSYFYMNVNQMNNGSGITGYVSWESYYAEDLFRELEKAIGREKSSYRIAHLGVSPAPSLMNGFYTVDGYSNNYSLEYKHQFRKIIEKELEKNEETRLYFDNWGSRCYLFNHVTGIYYNLKKGNTVKYENLQFDMEALRELGCEYLFSGGEIQDADRMGLLFKGYYETEDSYWGIWLYELQGT